MEEKRVPGSLKWKNYKYNIAMKVIRNNVLPFKGFSGINLFGVLFVRKNAIVSDRMLNHEKIHTAQMKEMCYVFFYLWYVIEWLIRLIQMKDAHKAYRWISFEVEAYGNELDQNYLKSRKPWSWTKWISN